MGIGGFNSGDVKLHISFRYHATDAEIDAWKLCLQYASDMLFYATNGEARIDEIVWANDWWASDDADAYITKSSYQSHVEQFGGLGQPSVHMYLAEDAGSSPYTVLHEFGHHALGLGDEYNSRDKAARCTNQQQTDHGCIMSDAPAYGGRPSKARIDGNGNLDEGLLREFCNSYNHVKHTNTSHFGEHGDKSCAEVIKDKFSIDVGPWNDAIVPLAIANADITWTPADSPWAISLVFDESDLAALPGSPGAIGAGPVGL